MHANFHDEWMSILSDIDPSSFAEKKGLLDYHHFFPWAKIAPICLRIDILECGFFLIKIQKIVLLSIVSV